MLQFLAEKYFAKTLTIIENGIDVYGLEVYSPQGAEVETYTSDGYYHITKKTGVSGDAMGTITVDLTSYKTLTFKGYCSGYVDGGRTSKIYIKNEEETVLARQNFTSDPTAYNLDVSNINEECTIVIDSWALQGYAETTMIANMKLE